MTARLENFAGLATPPPPFDQETEFEQCNFAQPAPRPGTPVRGVRLWPGNNTPRTFRRCNLSNCEPPPGSTIVDCNTALVSRQEETETATIDGTVLTARFDRVFYRGRLNPDGTYTRPPTPRDDGRFRKIEVEGG